MWIRMTSERFRVCPECRQLCLKVEEEFDNENEDYDPLTVCRDCNDEMVAALPDEYFRKLGALRKPTGDEALQGPPRSDT
jgi:hypothetical protein